MAKRKPPSSSIDKAKSKDTSSKKKMKVGEFARKSNKLNEAKPKATVQSCDDDVAEEPDMIEEGEAEFEDEEPVQPKLPESSRKRNARPKMREIKDTDSSFKSLISEDDARSTWPHRYMVSGKKGSNTYNWDDDELIIAKCHYREAIVDGYIYKLDKCAYVQAEAGEDDYICKIVEMFEGLDNALYFTAQWFNRTKNIVISNRLEEHVKQDPKRIFLSKVHNDNFLDCLVRPLRIVYIPLDMDISKKKNMIKNCDYYFDMLYLVPHCTFINPNPGVGVSGWRSTMSNEIKTTEMTMLDLYSGCGALSTGLCLGSNNNGVKLVTKWALDYNKDACDSLKLNHPETHVRNGDAANFLELIKEWHQVCSFYGLAKGLPHPELCLSNEVLDDESEEDAKDEEDKVYEVEKIIGVCYSSPPSEKPEKLGLYFKVQWKGYGEEEDSWEPIKGLRGCTEKLKEFVNKSYDERILPLPGKVDVICGGPPCQGISGFNRYRNPKKPLDDPKNQQIIVFMDIVEFLKPRFTLMENVVDLCRFSSAFLGRYAIARLVQMKYQARLGFMAAGAYGLAQFRMRAFVWAALPSEKLPPFPLPTHDVVVRGNVPKEFEECFVAYEDGIKPQLMNKLDLQDMIYDLPVIDNEEMRDIIKYTRKTKNDNSEIVIVFDHRPLRLNVDDHERVCKIPKRKGANFRDFPGLKVIDNKVELDLSVEREVLKSGKYLVPNYALTFVKGTSRKPFGRLWWDETVATVVTRAEPHNQIILHPEQDRVLSIRENARLQGFPDDYQLCGTVRHRYMQVGNAVAIPVGRALGHSLSLAARGLSSDEPTFILPKSLRRRSVKNGDEIVAELMIKRRN